MLIIYATTRMDVPALVTVESGAVKRDPGGSPIPKFVAVTCFDFKNQYEMIMVLANFFNISPFLARVIIIFGRARPPMSFTGHVFDRLKQKQDGHLPQRFQHDLECLLRKAELKEPMQDEPDDSEFLSIYQEQQLNKQLGDVPAEVEAFFLVCYREFFEFVTTDTLPEGAVGLKQTTSFLKYFQTHMTTVDKATGKTLKAELGAIFACSLIDSNISIPLTDTLVSRAVGFVNNAEKTPANSWQISGVISEHLVLETLRFLFSGKTQQADILLRLLTDKLADVKRMLGSADPSKGVLFQWMVVAQLLRMRGQPLSSLASEAKNVDWLKDVVLHFQTAPRDSGSTLPALITEQDSTKALTLINAARPELLGFANGVAVTAACRFYAKAGKLVAEDNRRSSNLTGLFCLKKPGELGEFIVNKQYERYHTAVKAAFKL